MAFELHPEFPSEGVVREDSPRRRAMQEQIRQMASEVNLPYVSAAKVPNSRLSLEAAEFAREKGRFEEYHEALFRAYFAEGRFIGDKAVLAGLARQVGLDPDELLEALDKRTYEKVVQEQVEQAQYLGITGVPAFIIGDRAIVGAQPYHVFQLAMSSLSTK